MNKNLERESRENGTLERETQKKKQIRENEKVHPLPQVGGGIYMYMDGDGLAH